MDFLKKLPSFFKVSTAKFCYMIVFFGNFWGGWKKSLIFLNNLSVDHSNGDTVKLQVSSGNW